mgnify:CR=1 FL=1
MRSVSGGEYSPKYRRYPAYPVPDDPAVLDEVARLLSFTVYRVLGKRLQPTDARRALTDTKTMQRLLRDANGSKARIVGGI